MSERGEGGKPPGAEGWQAPKPEKESKPGEQAGVYDVKDLQAGIAGQPTQEILAVKPGEVVKEPGIDEVIRQQIGELEAKRAKLEEELGRLGGGEVDLDRKTELIERLVPISTKIAELNEALEMPVEQNSTIEFKPAYRAQPPSRDATQIMAVPKAKAPSEIWKGIKGWLKKFFR